MADTHDPNPETAPEETQDSQQPQTGVKAKAKAATRHPLVRGALLVAAVIALLALVGSMCGDPSGESQDSPGSSTSKPKDSSSLGEKEYVRLQVVVRVVNATGEVKEESLMREVSLTDTDKFGKPFPRETLKWNTELKMGSMGRRYLHQAVLNYVCFGKGTQKFKDLVLCN